MDANFKLPAQQFFPHYLFGTYVIEISTFFETMFQNNITWDTAEPLSLQVFYGVARAAFRYQYKKFNGKVVLPMLNFWDANRKRDLSREKFKYIYDMDNYDPVTKTVPMMRNPAHFDITYSVNLWTNDERERDFIMHKLINAFPMGETTLVWFPDVTDRNSYVLMPLKMSEDFSDETTIESLEMKDVRDAIKQRFELTLHAIVPYNIYRIPVSSFFTAISDMSVYDPALKTWSHTEETLENDLVVGPDKDIIPISD